MKIVGTSSNGRSQESAFYSNTNRGRGRGGKTSFQGRHESSHGGHHQHEGQAHGGGRRNFKGKGSRGGHGGSHRSQQPNSDSNCYYCEKLGNMAKNYYQREHDCRNPTLKEVRGRHSHSRKMDLGVLRDSQTLRARLQGPKHLALRCFLYCWKGLEV